MTKAKDTKNETVQIVDTNTGKSRIISQAEFEAEEKQREKDAQPTEATSENQGSQEQDSGEVQAMLDFYTSHFDEVHSVTCLNCKRVIAVEVAPVKADGVVLRDKQRTLYTHNNLCLSVRKREDVTAEHKPMFGYQCICGNNTLLAKIEQGEVEERTIIKGPDGSVVSDSGPIAATSPFERAQVNATIRLKQASSKQKADYETDGTVERYETFKLERVK